MAAEQNTTGEASCIPTARSWRITSGAPTPEELAAVSVALSTVLAARTVQAAQETGSGFRNKAPWGLFSARSRTVTSWAADPLPGWRGAV
ncbi:acyl-CoA carboxylase epsilon subunit [Streptomyces sp. OR43]|uniref:acyl-CoA carboxylase epsilon subunit n=1 Tax=Streptomyces sp. or43 TaxID=2478957 RepID=UPI0011CDD1E7|nr:acyl-CoA carboxylase epsilon subunit [Streptomyces sp. or43]TXS47464.1 hypothetical protein EAO72_06600 [Streptomyces sp. or43]